MLSFRSRDIRNVLLVVNTVIVLLSGTHVVKAEDALTQKLTSDCARMKTHLESQGFKLTPHFVTVCCDCLTRIASASNRSQIPSACRTYAEDIFKEIISFKGVAPTPADKADFINALVGRCVKDPNKK